MGSQILLQRHTNVVIFLLACLKRRINLSMYERTLQSDIPKTDEDSVDS